MSTKFGSLIDFDLLKANTTPEIVLCGRGSHLGKSIWRHISAVGAPTCTKFGNLMQNNMQITAKLSISKSNMAAVFFKNGTSYISAIDW